MPAWPPNSLLALILTNMTVCRLANCSRLAFQMALSECTIMYIIGRCALWPGEPLRLSEIEIPNHWFVVLLRAA